jgi:predicted ATPase
MRPRIGSGQSPSSPSRPRFSRHRLSRVWGAPAVVRGDAELQQGTPPDAVYTFKHALVQDAAHDSLLKARRQQLHGKTARAIEERLPQTEATEPQLLAHRYTEAKQPEKAIPLWQRAGSLALERMALTEAIAQLNKGLELVATLPASAERDARSAHAVGHRMDGVQRLGGAGGLGRPAPGAGAGALASP